MRGRMRWGDSNVELPVQKEGTAIQQAEGRANEVLSHVPSCGSWLVVDGDESSRFDLRITIVPSPEVSLKLSAGI